MIELKQIKVGRVVQVLDDATFPRHFLSSDRIYQYTRALPLFGRLITASSPVL